MRKFNFYYLALLLGLFSLVTACQKEEEKEASGVERSTTEDNEQIEQVFEEVGNYVQNASLYDLSGRVEDVQDCGVYTVDKLTRTVTIDFGESGCVGRDGKTRKGKIFNVFAGRPGVRNSTVTTTFDNYRVNDHKVEGQHVLTYLGLDVQGNISSKSVVMAGKITFSDGTSIQRTSSYTRTWIRKAGNNDEFTLAGSGSGVNRAGVAYTFSIGNPITKKMACFNQSIFYPVSGQFFISPQGKEAFMVDFGSGNCDKELKLLIGGKTFTVVLP